MDFVANVFYYFLKKDFSCSALQAGYNNVGGMMKRFKDMVGKTYSYHSSDWNGEDKKTVLITSILEYKSYHEKIEWAWVTETNLDDYKDAIKRGCVFNAVDLFKAIDGEFPCWDFELTEII